jgi:plasmid stabilization system protein ParE
MAFRVEITENAERRRPGGILEWLISQQAGEAGLRWFQGLEKAIASLAALPGRCPLAPENEPFPFEVRQLLYGRRPHVYRVMFKVESETVYILHIWHGRRKPISMQ